MDEKDAPAKGAPLQEKTGSGNVSAGADKVPFPRTFYVANAVELFERMAFYGLFVGLSLYLTNVVGFSDKQSGAVMGNYRLLASIAPIVCGAVADRITFRRSLLIAFSLYVLTYFALFSFPGKGLTIASLVGIAIAGGFMKPVITGTVVRTAPEGRQTEGFAIFYRMINAGSVLGKSLAYVVRLASSMRFVILNSVAASMIALGVTAFFYREPEKGMAPKLSLMDTLREYRSALANPRFSAFLVIFSGFYFMADQFYFTFPKYITRVVDPKAPLELVTLINPAVIAIGQGTVTRLLRKVHPLTTMILGILIASLSMLVMGIAPGMVGACVSGAIFAVAEMTFSPRFYDTVAGFAPPGKAGMYMGLAFVPPALGSWLGGYASGHFVSNYIPEHGVRNPIVAWASYAGLGLFAALLMALYRFVILRVDGKKNARATLE